MKDKNGYYISFYLDNKYYCHFGTKFWAGDRIITEDEYIKDAIKKLNQNSGKLPTIR